MLQQNYFTSPGHFYKTCLAEKWTRRGLDLSLLLIEWETGSLILMVDFQGLKPKIIELGFAELYTAPL